MANGTVLLAITLVVLPIAAVALPLGGAWRRIGRATSRSSRRPRRSRRRAGPGRSPGPGGGGPPDARGEVLPAGGGRPRPIDVEAEVRRLLDEDGRPQAPAIDAELRDEVRRLVIARNERRVRRGEEPLDVEAETERQLAEFA